MPATSWKDLIASANEGAKEFALLDEGMYSFIIKDPAKIGQTGKGNPKFSINPSVESGPRANARVWHDFSVSESAYAMKNFFFGELAVLGLGPAFFEADPSNEQIASALQGKRFVGEVFHEDGNDGKKRAKLKNLSAPVGAPAAAGVPSGLPTAAAAPATQQAPSASPWPTAQAPAPGTPAVTDPWASSAQPQATPPFGNAVPLPPAF